MADLRVTPPLTHSPVDVRELLASRDLSPRRSLGQNFVADPNTVRRIARLAGVGPGDRVVEIGPGLGSLTLALVECGASVLAIEIDPDLVAILSDVVAGLDVEVVRADATTLDWASVLADEGATHVVANLPYNVATPIVLDLLRSAPVDTMLVMVQREVAERLAAGPGTSAVGVPSMIVAYYATARLVGHVPPSVFVPRPRVDSALVRIDRRARSAVDVPLGAIEPLLRTAYGQRRKMLRRSLSSLVDDDVFGDAGVDPTARPQDLSIEQWGELARARSRLQGS